MLFDRKRKAEGGDAPAPEADPTKVARNRLAGLWAAELLGLIGHAAHDYAREVAHAHEHVEGGHVGEEGGAADDEPVVRRLSRDLHGKVTAHEIREKLAHLLHEARRQLLNGDHKEK